MLQNLIIAFEAVTPMFLTIAVGFGTKKMGILDSTVTDVTVSGKNTYVIGTNFTPASRVYVNGFLRNAQFVDETTLLLEGFAAETGDVIRVAQVSDAIFQLSSTEDFVCP